MPIDTSLRTLANLIEAQREAGVDVESISAATEGAELTTTMRVAFPFEPATTALDVAVADTQYHDGTVAVDVSMTFDTADLAELAPSERATDDASSADVQDVASPAVPDSASPQAKPTESGPPAYKDPEQLREVYEAHESFAAMREALGVDVTAQTVRRNMMKHGIHEPKTGTDGGTTAGSPSNGPDSLSDGPDTERERAEHPEPDDAEPDIAESEPDSMDADGVAEGAGVPDDEPPLGSEPGTGEATPLATADESTPEFDDVDLPSDITPEAVRDAVAESSSLHGVQTALGLEMKDTRALLRDLGVLTYVTGRLADRTEKPDRREIEQQIYDSLAAHADGGRGPA